MRLCFTFITAIAVLAAPLPALAQQETRKLIVSERAIAEGMAPFDSRFSRGATESLAQGQRDSFKNGTIIGAVIGAVVMGSAVGALCRALQEPSDPSCWGSGLVGAAMGAGVGALGGLGIDALVTRSPRQSSPEPAPARGR